MRIRKDAFADVRQLLWTSSLDMRVGWTMGLGQEFFAAFPSWEADTLAFIPFPLSIIASSDPRTLRRLPRTVGVAIRHQRMLFREIAAGWTASSPRSAAAAQALSLALFLLGEPSAIDTLMRAKALAADPVERQRVLTTEIWMRVQFAVPADLRALRKARDLADSLLAVQPADPVDPEILSSIAALTGHAYQAASLARRDPPRVLHANTTPVKALSRSLVLFASFGGPADSLRVLESRIDSLITAFVPQEQRQAARVEAFGRALSLAFPDVAMASVSSFSAGDMTLLGADAAWLRGDTATVLGLLGNVRAIRQAFPSPPELSLDALYPEAWLLLSAGDAHGAAEWLDPTLSRIRISPPLSDPVSAATLVRAMAFRADVAARMGDRRTAAEWGAAVAVLWSGADEFLQPLVRRMHRLAMDGS